MNFPFAVEDQNGGGARDRLEPFPSIAARVTMGPHVTAGFYGVQKSLYRVLKGLVKLMLRPQARRRGAPRRSVLDFF
jgi:hypothetical protein